MYSGGVGMRTCCCGAELVRLKTAAGRMSSEVGAEPGRNAPCGGVLLYPHVFHSIIFCVARHSPFRVEIDHRGGPAMMVVEVERRALEAVQRKLTALAAALVPMYTLLTASLWTAQAINRQTNIFSFLSITGSDALDASYLCG